MTHTLLADITIKKNPSLKNINNITVLNPLDSTLMINQIKQLQDGPIHIYDYTFNPKHKANETTFERLIEHVLNERPTHPDRTFGGRGRKAQ